MSEYSRQCKQHQAAAEAAIAEESRKRLQAELDFNEPVVVKDDAIKAVDKEEGDAADDDVSNDDEDDDEAEMDSEDEDGKSTRMSLLL